MSERSDGPAWHRLRRAIWHTGMSAACLRALALSVARTACAQSPELLPGLDACAVAAAARNMAEAAREAAQWAAHRAALASERWVSAGNAVDLARQSTTGGNPVAHEVGLAAERVAATCREVDAAGEMCVRAWLVESVHGCSEDHREAVDAAMIYDDSAAMTAALAAIVRRHHPELIEEPPPC